MNRTASLSALAAFALAGSTAASASILGTYTFTGLTDLPATASSVDPLVAVGSLTEGAGSTFSVVNSPTVQTSGDVMRFVYSSAGNTTEAAAITANQYIEFTVTPQASTVDFTTITWTGSADTTTTGRSFTFFVRSSADSYAVTLDTQTNTSAAPQYSADLNISGLTGITSPINFRLFYYDNSSSGGHVYIDNLTVNGTAVIPEPASLALAGIGGLMFVGRRRQGCAGRAV